MWVDYKWMDRDIYNWCAELSTPRSYKTGDSLDFAVPSDFVKRFGEDPSFLEQVVRFAVAHGESWLLDYENKIMRVTKWAHKMPLVAF